MISEQAKPTLLVSLVLLGVLFSSNALACLCISQPTVTVDKEFARSTVVFIGSVDKIESAKPPVYDSTSSSYFYPFGKIVTFRVVSGWKGISDSTQRVFTGSDGRDCGINFQFGETYVIFASSYKGDKFPPYADICGLTKEVFSATDVIQHLDKIAKRTVVHPESDQ